MSARDGWEASAIARVAGGDWVTPPPGGLTVRGFSIDTRALRPQQAFVALAGERTDGHDHLDAAARAGAAMALVARVPAGAPAGLPMLRVPDPGEALIDLARAWREELERAGTRVLAVTGSNGKTTTVRLLASALASSMTGTHAERSFNNRLGLPLTLLNARAGDGFVVCEIGMNAPGEIAELTAVARPHVGVITSIGRAHLGGVSAPGASVEEGLAAIAREKGALLAGVGPGGVRIAPIASPPLEAELDAMRASGVTLLRFGEVESADARVSGVRVTPAGLSFAVTMKGRTHAASIPLLGRHNALNAAAALLAAVAAGAPVERALEGLARAEGPAMRLALERVGGAGGVTLLNDAYNANPDSMSAALRTLAEIEAPGVLRRVAVLGDMLELGEHAEAQHAGIGALAATLPTIGRLVAVGAAAAWIARGAQDAGAPFGVETAPELTPEGAERLASSFQPGDLVLLKGSRRMRLERVAEALRARAADAPVSS